MFGNDLNRRRSKKDKTRSMDADLENYLNQRNATLGEDAKSLFDEENDNDEMDEYVKHPARAPQLPKVGISIPKERSKEGQSEEYIRKREKIENENS